MASPQLVLLSYTMPDGTSDGIYLDASLNEQHGASAQVTDHQVESGPNVTDYIRPMPRRLSISGMVTNTPIATPKSQNRGVTGQNSSIQGSTPNGGRVDWTALQFNGEFDRVRDVYGSLVDAALAGAVFSVVTTLANYENFAIVNFSAPRNAQSGNSIQFQIDLQEIRIVTTQTVAALPGKAKKSRGAKPAKELDETKDAKHVSVIREGVKKITALFQ